jgi:2-polyprenyl-6-methoxyphenol hydroxylase-like FAD-dependent oxidoreductase
LLIGADGINSVVRKYVALELNKQEFGHLSCYRFLVEEPSSSLLKETTKSWNMSIGDHIHSPCYHVSREKETLSIVVLEYDGTPPSFPRHASREELMTVAKRSKLSFVQKILENEKISDLMCYSTFHIDCKPWHNASAAIIGDSAHAYGPLTAKMANLAINDAWTLSSLLNDGINKGIDQASILSRWENIQRPKFQATRLRTYRHLEMYAPRSRKVFRYLWKSFPLYLQQYFGSIFAYDYEVFDPKKPDILSKVPGVVGISHEDPLIAFCSRGLKKIGVASALGFFIYYTGMENSVSEWYRNIQMKS